MGCGCGKKKRMATYSSTQLKAQAAGDSDALVASATVMSPTTGQPVSNVDTAPRTAQHDSSV